MKIPARLKCGFYVARDPVMQGGFRRRKNGVKIDKNRYGKLSPRPIKKKIKNIIINDCVKAAVIAVPTKGAEHGVAINVTKNPVK